MENVGAQLLLAKGEPQRGIPLCFQSSSWITGTLARARFRLQIQRPLDFRTTPSANAPAKHMKSLKIARAFPTE